MSEPVWKSNDLSCHRAEMLGLVDEPECAACAEWIYSGTINSDHSGTCERKCRACERKSPEHNHPRGMMFVGWGHGWQTCSVCDGITIVFPSLPKADTRDERQEAVREWIVRAFGPNTVVISERVSRVIEEAVELAQSEGFNETMIMNIVKHVFAKEPGKPRQEVGGLGVTILAYCASKGLSADTEEKREFERVLRMPLQYFRKRQEVKHAAGIAIEANPDE